MKDTTVMAVQDTTGQMVKNPLSRHKRGWCKRIGKRVVVICGHLPADEGVRIYHRDREKIEARLRALDEAKGKAVTPVRVAYVSRRISPVVQASEKPCLTVQQLRDLYLAHKRAALASGEFAGRSLLSTISALDHFCKRVGGPVDHLTNQQFAAYRHRVARKYEVTTLARFVTQVRAMFAWAVRNHHITQLPPWGDGFQKVSAKQLRAYRLEQQRKKGQKKFSRDEIHAMLAHSSPILRAIPC
jgi:hypothetical protein